MKQKTILIIAGILLLGLTALTSCGENNKISHKEEIHKHDKSTYACPMHPEITGKDGKKCSKCGMNLVEVE